MCALQEQKLLEQEDNPTATSGGCWDHGCPEVKEDLQAKSLHKTDDEHKCFWSLWRVTISRTALWTCGRVSERPWGDPGTSYQDSHSIAFKPLSPKVILGESKEVRPASSSTATCLQVPQDIQRYHLTNTFQYSISTREEVTWWSICHSPWQCSAHSTVKTTALIACTPSLTPVTGASWQTAHPRSQLPVVFWLLCHKF